MPPPPPPAPTLPCKECGYVNEPERVYCHNCGAKLDRSVLPKEEQLRREAPDRARKRIMRMANPGGNLWKSIAINFVKSIVYGAVAAGIIVALRPPPDVPPEKPAMSDRLLGSELSETMLSRSPRTIRFTQNDINYYLGSGGRLKNDSSIPGVEFKRAFVNLVPGASRITIEKSIFGYPIYFGTLMRVEANAGVFVAVNVGGNVGRLPLHPSIMKFLGPVLFNPLKDGLKGELDQVRKAQALRVDKGSVTMMSKGGAQ
jgi:hypothetical protein